MGIQFLYGVRIPLTLPNIFIITQNLALLHDDVFNS